jgi:hypothetical protein
MDPELKKYLDRINEKQTTILQLLQKQSVKETWVTAQQVRETIGWTAKELDRARKLDQITYKRAESGGYLYKIESVSEQLIKKTA